LLRDERNLNTIAAREKQLELEQPPVFASNAQNAESNWLAELTVRRSSSCVDSRFW
jgi:hypothetical protein